MELYRHQPSKSRTALMVLTTAVAAFSTYCFTSFDHNNIVCQRHEASKTAYYCPYMDAPASYGFAGITFFTKDGKRICVDVIEGSAAQRAGIQPGDIITGYAMLDSSGHRYTSFRRTLAYNPGKKMLVVVQREINGKLETQQIHLTLGTLEDNWNPDIYEYLRTQRIADVSQKVKSIKNTPYNKFDLIVVSDNQSRWMPYVDYAEQNGLNVLKLNCDSQSDQAKLEELGLQSKPRFYRLENNQFLPFTNAELLAGPDEMVCDLHR